MNLTVISLFSGAGGLDLGLEKAGFEIRVCVEKVNERYDTIRKNRPQWNPLKTDIQKLSGREILKSGGLSREEVTLVSGGPPCQSFSKSAFWIPGRLDKLKCIQHSHLLGEFVRVVREVKPMAYMMENVHGLAYKTSRQVLENVLSLLKEAGYSANFKILNAADYGVPQKRKRLFIIGAKEGVWLQFPEPTHAGKESLNSERKNYVTAGDAIADLDDGKIDEHERVNGKWGHLLPKIPPGDNYLFLTKKRRYPDPIFEWRSRYWSFLLKLSPDQPSWTIQAHPGPYVGPFHWGNRQLRISEIKRLQTLPDNWLVSGDKREKWAQIGNAVPPLLAQKIGISIIEQLAHTSLIDHKMNTSKVL